jgi:hypothetical protein
VTAVGRHPVPAATVLTVVRTASDGDPFFGWTGAPGGGHLFHDEVLALLTPAQEVFASIPNLHDLPAVEAWLQT